MLSIPAIESCDVSVTPDPDQPVNVVPVDRRLFRWAAEVASREVVNGHRSPELALADERRGMCPGHMSRGQCWSAGNEGHYVRTEVPPEVKFASRSSG